MLQLAYFSTASAPQSADVLDDIQAVSSRNNARGGISGLLVAGGNRYMQVIEGPNREIGTLWTAIRADQRHCAVTELLRRPISERAFGKWSMAFNHENRLGEFDSFPKTLKFLSRQIEEQALRRQIEYFARSFIQPQANDDGTAWGLAL